MTALDWEGCVNVRDLGGLPTADGRTTAHGSVIRSDNLGDLTKRGWRSLAEHGVVRIVDLRWPAEREGESPPPVEVEIVSIPLLGESLDDDYLVELNASLDASPDVADHYAWSYVDFLERFRDRFGLALGAVAEVEGTVVVHCAGGKDRTGLISALLLRLAGVDRTVVAADYAVSEENLAPNGPAWIDGVDDELERERRRKLMLTPAEAMLQTLDELERRYGAVDEYLRRAGLDDAQIGRLRGRLLAGS
ncbi:MAG TPA: tyrosine-protein phosphatase [Gaiellaceae bacterium]|nr:tyrosine-protein phosphatase [Gaiellaceae bacterium]